MTTLERRLLVGAVAGLLLPACSAGSSGSETDPSESEATPDTDRREPPSKRPGSPRHTTRGPNRLPEDAEDQVWRFAVFPDTQGRDDDNMPKISNDRHGNDLGIEVYHGYDYNGDGVYDADGYRVNVSDPYNPYIETDDHGAPIAVAVEERRDFPRDFKIIPQPLVEAVTDKMIELEVDLVLATGDITEYRAESDYVTWLAKVAAPLQDAGIDVYPVRGNHEVVNGRNWLQWFSHVEEPTERQSVDNVLNGFSPYEEGDGFDQGYKLYEAYAGTLLAEKLEEGEIEGFPGAEILNYYFVHRNTLFIGIDFYFGDLVSSAHHGTWLLLSDWLHDVLKKYGRRVDHVVVYGHEPMSTKKRPQAYDAERHEHHLARERELKDAVAAASAMVELSQAALDEAIIGGASDDEIDRRVADLAAAEFALARAEDDLTENEEPGLIGYGYDIGQLGHLLLQDESDPGLAEGILRLFAKHNVNYFSGHDHQYARSLIHPGPEYAATTHGFTQIISGNASWKAYEDLYGFNDDYETGLFVDNFYNNEPVSGDGYNIHGALGKGVSFVVVEVNGRQITTTNYFASHNYTESDLNLGLRYDYDHNCWLTYSGSYRSGVPSTSSCTEVEWVEHDQASRTTNGTERVVSPYESYWIHSSSPERRGYKGSEATIIDGYNLTFDSSYAAAIDRVELMSELVSMSWFVDDDEETVSDVLWISGNQTQDGSHFDEFGNLLDGESFSMTYVNDRGYEVDNPTHVTRDGIMRKGVDVVVSLTGDTTTENGPGGSNQANWVNRYRDDGLDFADAVAIAFVAPEDHELTDLTLGRYNEDTSCWVPAFREECYTDAGYSHHFSVDFRISEQEPEGGFGIPGCQQFYWGYHPQSHSVWGHIHTDGRYALIEK